MYVKLFVSFSFHITYSLEWYHFTLSGGVYALQKYIPINIYLLSGFGVLHIK